MLWCSIRGSTEIFVSTVDMKFVQRCTTRIYSHHWRLSYPKYVCVFDTPERTIHRACAASRFRQFWHNTSTLRKRRPRTPRKSYTSLPKTSLPYCGVSRELNAADTRARVEVPPSPPTPPLGVRGRSDQSKHRETSNKALTAVNNLALVPFLMAFLSSRDQLPISTVTSAGASPNCRTAPREEYLMRPGTAIVASLNSSVPLRPYRRQSARGE